MRHTLSGLILLLLVALTAVTPGRPSLADGVYFDDTGPEFMRLGNSTYEVAFRRTNGAIASITDKVHGGRVSEGSRHECLWGAYQEGGSYVGGCHYSRTGANRFGYSWSAATHTLSLQYMPDPAASQQVTATVFVRASDDNTFDMRLELRSRWGAVLDYVLFPSDLVFREAAIGQALIPVLPGVALQPPFFDQNRSYLGKYPGEWFADYVALTLQGGDIALYSLHADAPIRPLVLGFLHDEDYLPDSTIFYHTFGARLVDGETWNSPWVRVRIAASPQASALAFRHDNGLADIPSLPAKLGPRYPRLAQSPLFKADATQLAIPFTQYGDFLAPVPTPAILHPVAFQPRGFDENYPDFLPPDPQWGTTAEMAAMFRQAQARGFTVMPYINPTWWDDESPTLRRLPPPLTIADIALAETSGVPRYEPYGPSDNQHWGYVVSPYVPFVQARLAQLISDMTTLLPSDMLFEDQVGARAWLFDTNPSSPSPTAYPQGWLEHTRTYSPTLLMTEMGYDRLVETEVGFHGSVLLWQRQGQTTRWWGADTWRPYPLAPMMFRDKVFFYQHDLAEEVMTQDKSTLAWNLAFGYLLSYDLGYGGGLNSDWLGIVSAFQNHVVARYAGEQLTDYTWLAANATRSDFEHTTVIRNWDGDAAYATGGYVLPPEGVLVQRDDGSLIAGIFTSYNGAPLSTDDHYLIEERGANEIIVRQPMGADTSLRLTRLLGWDSITRLGAWAYGRDGHLIGVAPVTVAGSQLTFIYRAQMAGQPVAYYRVAAAQQTYLPLILRW